ncbi:uncharacterized protein SOCEGT47_044510 [Sorangium cellulosum]|jgi:hypothetical protein|uniref:Secreted protein n=1 Tax=Sorangium cellulosum TaxID=56 RepID=A0A4P2Q439_SORCE|nr:DUF6184 family natural product biosynthesis lipoprotein [Sorangium cellulosum]AUX23921.1 uncharacterized protein SOCEGT47_044510 [Sorangium cellulosum]
MMQTYLWASLATTIFLVGAAGCDDAADTVNDALPGEASREARITQIAEAACDRYADTEAGCPGYGTGDEQTYETEGDCQRDFEERAADLWPASECGSGQINESRYDVCEERAKAVACSESIFDAIAALDECSAESVCTDPADE